MTITPVFDGHNDTLLRLVRHADTFDFLGENADGHLDLPRAKRGGMVGGIFAIFTSFPEDSPENENLWGMTFTEGGYRQDKHSAIDPAYAETFTRDVIERLRDLERRAQGALRVVERAAEIERNRAGGALSVVLHLEGAEAVREDLNNLEDFHRLGVRSLGLVWSRPNRFAEGVPFAFPASPDTGPGLTQAGRALVAACNEMGILIDLAHINEQGFFDVAKHSRAPLVVSHSNAHAICPTARNLTDRQIDAVGASGGIIGLNFEPMMTVASATPVPDMPLSQIVRHVEYIAGRVGIDHVGLGSDFDGTGMPEALGDASGLQKLVQAVREAGFTEEEVEKVAWKNWLRVLALTLDE